MYIGLHRRPSTPCLGAVPPLSLDCRSPVRCLSSSSPLPVRRCPPPPCKSVQYPAESATISALERHSASLAHLVVGPGGSPTKKIRASLLASISRSGPRGRLWGTNIRSFRFPIWWTGGDPSFVVPQPSDVYFASTTVFCHLGALFRSVRYANTSAAGRLISTVSLMLNAMWPSHALVDKAIPAEILTYAADEHSLPPSPSEGAAPRGSASPPVLPAARSCPPPRLARR